MKNGIILYQSKYGATQKYAQWLGEETGFSTIETKRAKLENVLSYDTIILMGGVYASGVAGLSFLKKHFQLLKSKQIFIFAVGASPYDEAAIQQAKAHNLQGEMSELPFFYGRGAWDFKGMTFVHRTLCSMLMKAVAKEDPATHEPWQKALMEAAKTEGACDWTDKGYLVPVVEALKATASI